jgi:hypothetical protein
MHVGLTLRGIFAMAVAPRLQDGGTEGPRADRPVTVTPNQPN